MAGVEIGDEFIFGNGRGDLQLRSEGGGALFSVGFWGSGAGEGGSFQHGGRSDPECKAPSIIHF